MWLDFAFNCVVGVVLMVLPGAALLRQLRMGRFGLVTLSPVVSVALLVVASLVLPSAGIPCTWWSMLVAMLLPALVVFAARTVLRRTSAGVGEIVRTGPHVDGVLSIGRRELPLDWCCIAAALLAGMITCIAVYLMCIGSPDAFVQNYDSAFHVNHLREFMDSGNYSSFSGGFYPSAWHAYVASIASATGASPFLAANAANSVIAAVAYPLSAVSLLAVAFPDRGRRVLLGSLFCTSIAYYPWRIMLFGPLYPNVLSFSLMPAAVSCFIMLCSSDLAKAARVRYGLLFVMSGVALTLSQPNAVFSAGVFLVPFIVYRIYRVSADQLKGARARSFALLFSCFFVAFVVVVWVALASSEALRATVTYPRDSPLSLSDALKWAFHFSFVLRRPQFVAGLLVAIGAIALLLERGRRWIPVSYLVSVLLYVVAISCDGHLREILTGFWYNDYHRLAAAVSVFAVLPLSTGLDCCVGGAASLARRIAAGRRNPAQPSKREGAIGAACCGLVLLGVMVFNTFPLPFLPNSIRAYGFDAVRFELRDMYNTSEKGPLDDEELAFLDRVGEEIEEGAVVANQPYDGSVFAYASDGLNVVFDRYNPPSDEDHVLLRTSLYDIETNQDVDDAVDELDVSYVLQLDAGDAETGMSDDATYYPHGYAAEGWRGINEIDENTPGFTLVLSDGDMRLYRIDG